MNTTLPVASSPAPTSSYCFELGRGKFWLTDPQGGWIPMNESQFKRVMRKNGVSRQIAEGATVSPLEDLLIETYHSRAVQYAGSLAGHAQGLHQVEGKQILVTDSPQIIPLRPGLWPTLEAVFTGLFKDEQADQLPYFYGWLKTAYTALLTGRHRPGQALVIAGERGCGKSLVQNLITLILGGRSARPYQFMSGATTFNSDLFKAEHLMIEDEQASVDTRARRNFGTQVKGLTVNRWQRYHAKNREALTLAPFWRLSVTVNDEPENLMVLPPLDESLEDKFIILRARTFPMPMATFGAEERALFWRKLTRELPAFLDFLNQWPIPEELRCQRFGVRHFHHPALLEAIDALSPEMQLLRLIDEVIFNDAAVAGPWIGTADQLERILRKKGGPCGVDVRKLFAFSSACGVYLARLQKRHPRRFMVRKETWKSEWEIRVAA